MQTCRVLEQGFAAHWRDRGFTLVETVLVIGLLALVSLGIASMQPSVFKTQTNGRDQLVGVELARSCAERLLAVRRQVGFASVTNTLCNGMGGVGGFVDNPTVAMVDSAASGVSTCSSSTCTITISIAKATAPLGNSSALTLQLSAY